MDNEKIRKILIIRFSSMGDVILTSPLTELTKKIFPNAKIDFCVKRKYSYFVKSNKTINNVIIADDELKYSSLKKLIKQIKQTKYDLIIDAQNNLKSFYIRLLIQGNKLVFNKHSFKKLLLVKFKINLLRNSKPIINRYKSILKDYALRNEIDATELPSVFLNKESEQKIENFLNEISIPKDSKKICIPIVSGHFTKTYPKEYYAELINKFSANTVFFLIGIERDKNTADYIIENVNKGNAYNLCGSLASEDLVSLLNRCDIIIGGDTGPIHIAESLNKPLIMLAGSSVKEFGFYPQNNKAIVIENNNIKCRPCSHIGKSKCPKGHFKCMKDLYPETVWEKIKTLL
jgi:heptosyltransferase-2